MSSEGIGELMERWTNDPAFRTSLRDDPEGAVRASGISLSEDEMAALRHMDWSASDEELTSRVSKARWWAM